MSIKNIYYLVTSSRSFIIQMVFTLNAIYYVSNAGLNPLELVLIGTILEVSVLLFEIPTGLVADFFGRKRSLIIGMIILGLAHLLEGSFPVFWAIAAGSALWGVGWTFISGAEQAWIADELEGRDLDQVFLRGAQFSSFARFSGILFSVLLATIFSVQATIVIAGGLLIILAVIAFFIMPETKFVTSAREGVSGLTQMLSAIKGGVSHIRGNSVLVSIAFITLFWGLASEGFDRLWGAQFIETFNLPEEQSIYWFGALYAVAFLLNMAVLKVVELRVKRQYAAVLLMTNGVLTVFMMVFAFINQFWIAVMLYWAIAALRNVNYPLMSVMTNERLESKGRATALSMFGQLDALGQVAGGPLVGLIALYTSISGGISTSAILIIPTLYFLWRMTRSV